MRRFLIILFISPLISFPIFAQTTLTGAVYDENGKPIVGATIQITALKTGDISDTDGSYKIDNLPKGKFNLKASSIGFTSQTKSISIDKARHTLDFTLTTSYLKHQEIVITEKSPIQEMREAPEAITVIDAKEIHGKAVSLDRVLNKAVGIKIRQSGGIGSDSRVMIHGLEGNRIQVLVDDNPVYAPEGSFSIEDIPIDMIERIEVYKGIVPARFGGDGLGGAVNVIIRDYETDYIDLTYERSSYNTNRASWVFKKNFEEPGIRLGLGGFYNSSDNDYSFTSPDQDNLTITRDHDQFNSFLIGLTSDFIKLWFDKITFEFIYYSKHKEIQGILSNIQHAESKSALYIAVQKFEKECFFHKNLDFKLNSLIGFGTNNFIDTSHYQYTFDGQPYPSPSLQGEIGFWPNDSDDKIFEVRERINLLYEFLPSHSLNLNSAFRYVDKNPSDDLASRFAGYNVSGYPSNMHSFVTGLTYEIKLIDDAFINMLSGKYFHLYSNVPSIHQLNTDTPENISITRNDFGFSEAFRWRALSYLIFKASYQHALRLPIPDELFGDGILIYPSPNLKPEKSNNLNLGLMFDKNDFLGMERVQFELNGFYRDVKDMIKLLTVSFESVYANLEHIKIKGVEAELKIDFSQTFYGYINGTYQNARDAQKYIKGTSILSPTYNLRVPNLPYLFGNFGFEYHSENLFGSGHFTKIYWDSQFTEEFFYNWQVSQKQDRIIPSSFIHDIGILHSFDNNKYSIGFEVHNITDSEVWNIYRSPLAGRTFHMKFRYTFMEGH